jgi:hypothetical protein
MNRIRSRHLEIAGLSLVAFGAILALGSFIGHHSCPGWIPLPLGDLESITVDDQGRIYCLSGFYSRLQVYSSEGEYLTGWPVPYWRAMYMRVNSDGNIDIIASTGLRIFTYSWRGRLLKRYDPSADKEFFPTPSGSCITADGRRYCIRNPLLYPHVVLVSEDGHETVVVSPPRLSWFIMGPVPAFGYVWVGLILTVIGRLRQYKRDKQSEM